MNAFNYKPPIVSNMTRGHGPTTGAVSLTIIGENFGSSDGENRAQAGVGNTLCSSVGWTSDTSIGCRLHAGIGKALDVWVRIACGPYMGSPRYTCRTSAEAESSIKHTFFYDAPFLSQVTYPSGASSVAARGNLTVTFEGSNFGTYAGTALNVTIGATDCSSAKWTSDSSITCVTSGGVGTNDIKIVKSVDAQEVEAVWNGSFKYAGPVIANLSPDFAVSSGGQSVTVIGHNFSPFDHSPRVKLGSTTA